MTIVEKVPLDRKDLIDPTLTEISILLSEMESIIQSDLQEYRHRHVAGTLEDLANMHQRIGESQSAAQYWRRAAEIAGAGQKSNSSQEVHDNASILRSLSEDMARAGLFDDAQRIAWSIIFPSKREAAIRTIASLMNGAPESS